MKEPSASPVAKSPDIPSSLPVIKPVSKMGLKSSSSEEVSVQTTSSPKNPITITRYIPPDKKQPASFTKVKISVLSEDKERKDAKPSKEADKEAKPKEMATKPKETKETKPKETKETKPKETKEGKHKELKEVKPKEAKEAKGKESKDAKTKEMKEAKAEKIPTKTIKTLMPMRPPTTAENKETTDVKPKDVK